jgi:hypothetical protein
MEDMSDRYPATFEVLERPQTFDRGHILLRLALLVAISLLAAFVWLIALIYLVIPIVAAALLSRDQDGFLTNDAPRVKRLIHWVASFDAYLVLLTDRFPLDGPEVNSRMDIAYSGQPTVGSAVLRLVTSIPSSLCLIALGIASTITGVVSGVCILLTETYPEPLYRFHTAAVRWTARLLAYHASLTDQYPPFELDTDMPSTTGRIGPPAQEPA